MSRNPIFTLLTTLGISLCLSSPLSAQTAGSQGSVEIVGSLNGSRDGLAPSQLEVTVNGAPISLSREGRFIQEISRADYYRVEVRGETIFPVIQTFANAELADSACQCLSVPSIELVAKKPGRIELLFGGDTMAGRRFFERGGGREPVLREENVAADLDQLLAPVKPYIEAADYASINLETVLASEDPDTPAPRQIILRSTPQLAGALARAGVDHVSLGNNHLADFRDAGVISTINALNEAGVAWSGAGRNSAEAERPAQVKVGDTELSLLGFVGWRGKGQPNQIATLTKAGAALGSGNTISRTTRTAALTGRVPVIQIHGSPVYSDRPSDLRMYRLEQSVRRGAPIALGHNPNVVHGLRSFNGGLIAPSLGNFLSDQDRPQTHFSYLLKVWLENGRFLRAEAVPIQMLDYQPIPATGEMRRRIMSRLAWLSAEMDTHLHQSGGHLAIWANEAAAPVKPCTVEPRKGLNNFNPVCQNAARDLGRDLIVRGDFESSNWGANQETFWRARHAELQYNRSAEGEGTLRLDPVSSSRPVYLFSRTYLRDIRSTRFTMKARVKTAQPVTVQLFAKPRPAKDDPNTPLISGTLLGETTLSQSSWQDVTFNFILSPEQRFGHKAGAFRPILKFSASGEDAAVPAPIELDDVALVEWARGKDKRDPEQGWRWTHIRLPQQFAGSQR
jgi:poly-gamma-glutamate capsule biosynthesis protein CapA/YwtB (metallophosphatase superfamily)